MFQANLNPSIQAEQIDIFRNQPTLKCQNDQNYQNDQYFLFLLIIPILEMKFRVLRQIRKNQFFSKSLKEKRKIVYQIKLQLNRQNLNNQPNRKLDLYQILFRIHASHQLGGVFLFIVTSIKLLGLNNLTPTALTIAILIVISSLLWIVSVTIGTIGIRRQKYNPLIFYFLGIIVSFIIEFSSTIVILATNHIADHQLGIYNKNVIIRFISISNIIQDDCFYDTRINGPSILNHDASISKLNQIIIY
ncbi:unnamed protein product [Paramecium sonneborni]|uniref:Transmembrane protein n=1 Tax=Paramecium sonneborni TaxID=65129 RepID=A0A8S1NNN4_9CILI|nr:unnamed protein product [Paramecium sonneborni]